MIPNFASAALLKLLTQFHCNYLNNIHYNFSTICSLISHSCRVSEDRCLPLTNFWSNFSILRKVEMGKFTLFKNDLEYVIDSFSNCVILGRKFKQNQFHTTTCKEIHKLQVWKALLIQFALSNGKKFFKSTGKNIFTFENIYLLPFQHFQ